MRSQLKTLNRFRSCSGSHITYHCSFQDDIRRLLIIFLELCQRYSILVFNMIFFFHFYIFNHFLYLIFKKKAQLID